LIVQFLKFYQDFAERDMNISDFMGTRGMIINIENRKCEFQELVFRRILTGIFYFQYLDINIFAKERCSVSEAGCLSESA